MSRDHRSGSMSGTDRQPLPGTPATARILRSANNRLGAVYGAMYSFWTARAQALDRSVAADNRRDSYSAILFESTAMTVFQNDFRSTPDALLTRFLNYYSTGGTNFDAALRMTQSIMDQNWSTERYVHERARRGMRSMLTSLPECRLSYFCLMVNAVSATT